MKNLNPLKIYSIAILYLILPEVIRHKFNFKKTPTESLAIGTIMTRIVYWKPLLKKPKIDRELYFTNRANYK